MAGLRYGYRLGFLSYAEIVNRNPSPKSMQCEHFLHTVVQCGHQIWSPSPSLAM